MDKVVEGARESVYLPNFLTGDKLLLVVHGQTIAGIDLSHLKAGDVHIDGRIVHIHLPDPEVFATTIDNAKTRVYSRETGLLVQADPNLESEVRAKAQQDLQKAAQYYAAELGVRVRRISIRDQSSRWGSCTSAGALSFSWRLILAPPFVLDYLAAHEVAHLVEMNHSPRFWKVVAKVCASVTRAKNWLDTNGNDLHRYGIED